MNLSIVIVSYESYHLIEKIILATQNKFEVIVIENSLDINLKNKLETKYTNIQVIIPSKNLGYAKSINLGLKKAKNKFVFFMAADVEISTKSFTELSNLVDTFNDFTMLAPTYFNEKIYKNYVFKKKDLGKKIRKINDYNLIEVEEIDGAAFIINKNKIDTNEIMDEKFFLYYESSDLCLRFRKEGKKLFVVDNCKFIHYGTKSSHPDIKIDIQISRNWHYCWSKFYFFNKHFGYFTGIRKTLPNLRKALTMCFINFLKNDKHLFKLHKAELSGLINSYFLKKSFYRILKDKKLEKIRKVD